MALALSIFWVGRYLFFLLVCNGRIFFFFSFVPFTNCFVCRWFCVVHDLKPPLHSHNWLSFGKFQDTERFLIHCERHFSSRLPPSGGTWKYFKVPSTKKTWRNSLPTDMLLSAVSVLVVAQSSSEIPEGLMNNPVFEDYNQIINSSTHC